MTERIQGPSGPPESSRPGSRGARRVDSNRFKEEMRRVDEVSKIDPDEAKKRKRPEEALREEEASRASPKEESKAPSPHQEAFKISASETALPEGKEVNTAGEVARERAEEPPQEEQALSPKKQEAEEKLPTPLGHEEGVRSFLSEVEERAEAGGMLKTRIAEVEEGVSMPVSPDASEEEKKRSAATPVDRNREASEVGSKPEEPPQVEELEQEQESSLSKDPPPPYTYLHPAVLDIFERTVGAMLYMHEAGIKETTIVIQSGEAKPSVFDGARITIREYSTAPKEFNVELSGAPKAVDLFQSNMQDLRMAFDGVPAKFTVKQIETSYQ